VTGGLLTDAEVAQALSARPGWRRAGGALVRRLQMKDFEEALAFVERVGAAAVDYGRRPDMCISEQNHVRLEIANLNHAGFSLAELRLARMVDGILDAHHPRAARRAASRRQTPSPPTAPGAVRDRPWRGAAPGLPDGP
jgi:4a-hydroxytetrahydrobiopterin dehydratase